MLFTDASISSVTDLLAYESEIEEVAGMAGLNLDKKLELAQTEISTELLANAATYSGSETVGIGAFTLHQVVVTDALRLWHTFHTLSIVYRDAYNRKVNDKYLVKGNEYRALAKWAANIYFNIGVGLVSRPMAAPAAPQLSSAAGGALPAQDCFACTTWVDGNGAESAPSPAVSYSLAAGELLVVTPAADPPAGHPAVGWFAYAGASSGSEQRQSAAPIAIGASWTMPETGLAAGAMPGTGQAPEYYRRLARTLQRG